MRSVASALVLLLVFLPGSAGAQTSGLTAGPQLARVYDAILDARFDRVPALLTQTCGPNLAPPEACQLLDLVSLWWQIQLDPKNRVLDERFQTRSDAAIAAIEAWTRREPTRAEAWFYLGGAYGARAQWRVLREERLAAARDGKRIKNSLEQALALDPSLRDAYFGIGLYHYYADVAPAALRMLRWLLLLPAGNRVQGLEEMLRARKDGQLLQSEADFQLHLIYLWYEKQPAARPAVAARSARTAPRESAVPAAHRQRAGRLRARSAGQPRDLAVAARSGASGAGRRTGDERGRRETRPRRAARSTFGQRVSPSALTDDCGDEALRATGHRRERTGADGTAPSIILVGATRRSRRIEPRSRAFLRAIPIGSRAPRERDCARRTCDRNDDRSRALQNVRASADT